MLPNFDANLRRYADLLIKVGLNVQPEQRLLISAPLASATLARQIAASAYQAGARLVDVLYNDEEVTLIRFEHAPRHTFSEPPTWFTRIALDYAEHGDAICSIAGGNPDLLKGQDPELIKQYQQALSLAAKPYSAYISRDALNWLVASYPVGSWAAKVFPAAPADQQVDLLWEAIFKTCRIDQPDPVAAWQQHLRQLSAVGQYLTGKQYAALHYTGPGTDLTIGLPRQHIWVSGQSLTPGGIAFTANMPTEEVFTLPHKDQINGTVRASRPLSYGGSLLEDFSLTFKDGHVVEARAAKGEDLLRSVIATDEGASSLGEVALVPHSSPISQSGLMFFNTLFDENAASHLALGRAYRNCLTGGAELSDEAFAAQGGNNSLIHIDFMIGSGAIDIDALTVDGQSEALMRHGEWAFTL